MNSTLDHTNGIMFTRWMDNSVVTIASTCYGIEPVGQVKRYSKKEKKFMNCPRPNVVAKYNNFMGGTDLMDENISRHRISIRSKKWWWSIFTWMLDVSIVNAWTVQRKAGLDITQLEFRREIVQVYLTRFGELPRGPGRSFSLSSVPGHLNDIRYDKEDHLIVKVPNNKRRRCAAALCKSVGRTMCKKCDVGLCTGCFYSFHKK